MKIEVQEFYPTQNAKKGQRYIGTLHIYLVETEEDLRGIKVYKSGNRFFFQMPGQQVKDEDGELVFYPYHSFMPDKQREFLQEMVKVGVEFMRKYYKDKKKRG